MCSDDSKALRSFRKRHLSLSELIDAETGWYRRWYFMARLGDEIAESAQEQRQLTLVYAKLPIGGWDEESRLRVHLTVRLALIERESRVANVCFGRLSEDEFAVLIPNAEGLERSAAAEMFERQLMGLSAETSLVSYPDDGADPAGLLAAARGGLDRPPSNVIDLEAYRLRRGRKAA